jgi:hypothetical protein
MLVQMHDFHGWSPGAWWQDLKFDLKHFSGLDRLALVGDCKWEPGTAAFCHPITWANVGYFDETNADEARNWINEGIAESVRTIPHDRADGSGGA